jgi:hypothetical protein
VTRTGARREVSLVAGLQRVAGIDPGRIQPLPLQETGAELRAEPFAQCQQFRTRPGRRIPSQPLEAFLQQGLRLRQPIRVGHLQRQSEFPVALNQLVRDGPGRGVIGQHGQPVRHAGSRRADQHNVTARRPAFIHQRGDGIPLRATCHAGAAEFQYDPI